MGGQPHSPTLRKRGRPTADERRARETEILTAALGVFLRSGYGASTLDELAAAAQVTKRTLYAYYGDKAGLFAAMVTHLAATVSLDATSDDDTLALLTARIVGRLHSDELVGLHRLVIAESTRFPELAVTLHSSGDARHIARLAEHIRAERGPASAPLAEPLFSLLLGEKHRRRLLGIDPPPTPAQAAAHADAALAQLGLKQAIALPGRLTARLSGTSAPAPRRRMPGSVEPRSVPPEDLDLDLTAVAGRPGGSAGRTSPRSRRTPPPHPSLYAGQTTGRAAGRWRFDGRRGQRRRKNPRQARVPGRRDCRRAWLSGRGRRTAGG